MLVVLLLKSLIYMSMNHASLPVDSSTIFTKTSGVQEGSSIVFLLTILNTPLFFFGVQVPFFSYRQALLKV